MATKPSAPTTQPTVPLKEKILSGFRYRFHNDRLQLDMNSQALEEFMASAAPAVANQQELEDSVYVFNHSAWRLLRLMTVVKSAVGPAFGPPPDGSETHFLTR